MNPIELLECTLHQVVERVGDPAPQVYERLFAQSPALREMFVNDPLGSVRGEMFHRALEAMPPDELGARRGALRRRNHRKRRRCDAAGW